MDEARTKEACSVRGMNVCRQQSFIIAVFCGTSVSMTKQKACKKLPAQQQQKLPFSSWKVYARHRRTVRVYSFFSCLAQFRIRVTRCHENTNSRNVTLCSLVLQKWNLQLAIFRVLPGIQVSSSSES